MTATRIALGAIVALAVLLLLESCLAFEELVTSAKKGMEDKAAGREAGNWDLARLDTARAASYLSEGEKDVVRVMS